MALAASVGRQSVAGDVREAGDYRAVHKSAGDRSASKTPTVTGSTIQEVMFSPYLSCCLVVNIKKRIYFHLLLLQLLNNACQLCYTKKPPQKKVTYLNDLD